PVGGSVKSPRGGSLPNFAYSSLLNQFSEKLLFCSDSGLAWAARTWGSAIEAAAFGTGVAGAALPRACLCGLTTGFCGQSATGAGAGPGCGRSRDGGPTGGGGPA